MAEYSYANGGISKGQVLVHPGGVPLWPYHLTVVTDEEAEEIRRQEVEKKRLRELSALVDSALRKSPADSFLEALEGLLQKHYVRAHEKTSRI